VLLNLCFFSTISISAIAWFERSFFLGFFIKGEHKFQILRFLICITLIKRLFSICLLLHSFVELIHYDCRQWYIHQMISIIFFSLYRSTKRFGPDGKRFEHLSFLSLAQNVVCFICSYIREFHSTFIFWLYLLLKWYV
jgi:hypothetical protein